MKSASQIVPPILLSAAVGFVLLLAGNVSAVAADDLRLSGFGTVGYTADNRSDMAPARDISQKPRDGFATGGSWRMDSRLGAQLEYRVSPIVDLVGQIVLRDRFKPDLDNSMELAYVSLRPQADLDVRAGRINYDAFLMSDHRNVGYAYTWVRPPLEFYGWIPIFSLDGVDAAYNFHTDDANWRIKAQAGRSKFSIPIGAGYDFRTNNLLGLSVSMRTALWRLKAAHSQFTVASEVPAFASAHAGLDLVSAAAIPAVSAEAADLRRNFSFKDARITYTTLGAAYDDGVWTVQAEFARSTTTAAVVPHARVAYASVGRRFGDWTPYLLLSASRPGNDLRTVAANWGAFNAALRDPVIYNLNTTRVEQDAVSVGTRWDFNRRAALKLQWDSTTVKPSGYGLWWRDPAINGQTSRVRQISATIDFAF